MAYNKYGVSSKSDRTMDNITFASKKEMLRYYELKMLLKAGEITNLELQPKYLLLEGFTKNGEWFPPINYIADFKYIENGETIIEDCKGMKTVVYTIKRKLFEYEYKNLTIKEV